MLTENDLQQIIEEGLDIERIYEQLEIFAQGIPFVQIVTAASAGNGIELIDNENQQQLVDLFESKRHDLDIVKFVPASGAATRMFGFLYQFLNEFDPEKKKLNDYLKNGNYSDLSKFLKSLKDLLILLTSLVYFWLVLCMFYFCALVIV